MIRRIDYKSGRGLATLTNESCDAIVISTGFNLADKSASAPADLSLSDTSVHLLRECARILRFGGLLFVYGLPRELAAWGEHLAATKDDSQQMVFKYWLALDIDDAATKEFLKPSHLGLLLFCKSEVGVKKPTPFALDTEAARVPHGYCAACKQTLKDWGGKKHLMHPHGSALSDVWRDLPRRRIIDGIIPNDVLKRVELLSGAGAGGLLHIVQSRSRRREEAEASKSTTPSSSNGQWSKLTQLDPDKVYSGDCVSFLHRVKELHPEGVFDLAFADPPYNLEKKYAAYSDALAEREYLDWCNAWLSGMAETLKPGGSLFVVNLPKWAIHHAGFLNPRLDFRHWIVWDALSDPRGKLMPAHYALLWYTKPGGKPACNYSPASAKPRAGFVLPPDAPRYCLRAACVKTRKATGKDDKVELSDVWFDVHRIKHKRDRDAHPCQLPEKLMERIITLTTQPGDLVFDPFCGAGTTAIAAKKLGRKFVTTEVDKNYVHITNEKLAAMNEHADLFGSYIVPRESKARPRGVSTKRGIEVYLQQLARKLGRPPTEHDVAHDQPEILRQIDTTYPTRSAAFKRAKLALETR